MLCLAADISYLAPKPCAPYSRTTITEEVSGTFDKLRNQTSCVLLSLLLFVGSKLHSAGRDDGRDLVDGHGSAYNGAMHT